MVIGYKYSQVMRNKINNFSFSPQVLLLHNILYLEQFYNIIY